MNKRSSISLDSIDSARVIDVEEAYNLATCHELPEADQRAFRRVRGNDFTVDDARAAADAIQRRRDFLHQHADATTVSSDPAAQASWVNGVKSSADQALQKMHHFLLSLGGDLGRWRLAHPND